MPHFQQSASRKERTHERAHEGRGVGDFSCGHDYTKDVLANHHSCDVSMMSFIGQAMRFAMTGIVLTAFGYALIVSLTTIFGVGPYLANFLVYGAGLFFSYWVNARLVFRDRTRLKSFVKFLLSF